MWSANIPAITVSRSLDRRAPVIAGAFRAALVLHPTVKTAFQEQEFAWENAQKAY
jgi:hypothetical protein